MSVQITIRNVPDEVRDELASRAALQGKSLQEFLRGELERIATRASMDKWLESVGQRKSVTKTRLSAKRLLQHRDADRR